MINLLTGSRATKNTSPTTLPSIIGPTLNAQTSTGWVTDGTISETVTADTIAAILIPTASTAIGWFLVKSNTNTTSLLGGVQIASLVPHYRSQGLGFSSGLTLSLNVPYFIAGSFRNGNQNWVVVNLLTGQILAAVNTSAITMNNSSAPYGIGGSFTVGRSAGAQIAAVMLTTNRFLRPQALLAWARDPWSFWYPAESDPNAMRC